MKKITKKSGFSLLLALFVSAFVFVGCEKNNTTDIPVVPGVVNFGVEGDETTILVSDKIEFNPEFVNSPTKWEWQVNGAVAKTTSSFTFEPETTGRYTISLVLSNEAGVTTKSVDVIVKNRIGGFYIVNEGWFGHDNGSINYFDTEKGEFSSGLYKNANPDSELGVTTCYGTIWGDVFYVVSKQQGKLIAADAYSFEHIKTLDYIEGDGRAFVGIDSEKGVFTTSSGCFIVNLEHLCIEKELEGTNGKECTDVVVTDKYLFIGHSYYGVLVYSRNDFSLVKTLDDIVPGEPGDHQAKVAGIVKSKDGNVWVGEASMFIKIDPNTLSAEQFKHENIKLSTSWGYWHPASFIASKFENVLYFAQGYKKDIYRYKIGDNSSLDTPFAVSRDSEDAIYGQGFGEDPISGDIVATYVKDGWGDSYKSNRIVIFDSKSGAEKKRYTKEQLGDEFEYFWFPSMIVFNN